MNKNAKKGILVGGIIILLAAGVFAASTYASQDSTGLFHSPGLLKTDVAPDTTNMPCDQTATTTPCSQIEAIQKAAAQAIAQAKPKQTPAAVTPTYGPLVNTYNDSNYGFSLQYPDQLHIINVGDTELLSDGEKPGFAIKICDPGSPCGKDYANLSPQSLKDFEQPLSVTDAGESTTYGQMTYKEIPTSIMTFTTPSGLSVLKEDVEPKLFDSKGNDITAAECEECTGDKLIYIAFKNPQDYVIFWVLNGDNAEIEKVIDSVSY